MPRQDVRVFTKKFKKMIFFIDIEKDKRYTKSMNEIKNKMNQIWIQIMLQKKKENKKNKIN